MKKETGKSFEHGTLILIEDLKVKVYPSYALEDDVRGRLIPKIRRVYRNVLRDKTLNLSIYYKNIDGSAENRVEVIPWQYDDLLCKVNFSFTLKNDDRELFINGWAGLYNSLLGKENYRYKGFSVIKNKKIILENEYIGYENHPETRLLVGEIELVNFETTHDKTDFVRNQDWDAMVAVLEGYIINSLTSIAKSEYMNRIKDSIKNKEFLNINKDLYGMLHKAARKCDSEGLYISDFQYEIINREINIDESEFVEALKKIQNNTDILSALDVAADKNRMQTRKNNGLVSERETDNNNLMVVETPEYLKYTMSFKIDKLTVFHQAMPLSDKDDSCFEVNNKEISIITNADKYDYENETFSKFCFNNIFNSVFDYNVAVLSESMTLNSVVLNVLRRDLNLKTKVAYNEIMKANNLQEI